LTPYFAHVCIFYRLACELAKAGAELAFEYYQQREALTVDHKGDDLQDAGL
jgi:myo-inositol-1(or 4)-monophosphatase